MSTTEPDLNRWKHWIVVHRRGYARTCSAVGVALIAVLFRLGGLLSARVWVAAVLVSVTFAWLALIPDQFERRAGVRLVRPGTNQ